MSGATQRSDQVIPYGCSGRKTVHRTESPQLSYHVAHYYVSKTRGRARRHQCIDCGQPARQWSYDHADPDELESPAGLQYSVDPQHYDPRCMTCHRTFDQQHRRTELQAIAEPIVNQVKHAVAQRDRARRHRDRDAEDYWDDELERLIKPVRDKLASRTTPQPTGE